MKRRSGAGRASPRRSIQPLLEIESRTLSYRVLDTVLALSAVRSRAGSGHDTGAVEASDARSLGKRPAEPRAGERRHQRAREEALAARHARASASVSAMKGPFASVYGMLCA
jgi:hypothetical protein